LSKEKSEGKTGTRVARECPEPEKNTDRSRGLKPKAGAGKTSPRESKKNGGEEGGPFPQGKKAESIAKNGFTLRMFRGGLNYQKMANRGKKGEEAEGP